MAYLLARGPDGGLGALDGSVVRLRGGLARLAGNLGHLRPSANHAWHVVLGDSLFPCHALSTTGCT